MIASRFYRMHHVVSNLDVSERDVYKPRAKWDNAVSRCRIKMQISPGKYSRMSNVLLL